MNYKNMDLNSFLVAFISLYLSESTEADDDGDVKKINFYEQDLSEFCRRRVIPSIFLGRNAVEASSFVLHFTRLELPYSCVVSIRAESGSNMVMVVQMRSEDSLAIRYACTYTSPPLVVYELGETFGGYWGPLPESMMKQNPPPTMFYTLKTTQPTTISVETTTQPTTTTPAPPTTSRSLSDLDEFIRVEVPIAEVSGQLMPGDQQPTKAFDADEAFDLQYDVTPIPGEKYDTSILPLVQLSVRKQPDGRRGGQDPLYELDVDSFTPDSRLNLPKYTPHRQNQRMNLNKRLKFGKSKATRGPIYKKFSRMSLRKHIFTEYTFPVTVPEIKSSVLHAPHSWEMIDELMEKLNKNKGLATHHLTSDYGGNTSKIAEHISNTKHNFSIYLSPNVSDYNNSESSDSSFTTEIPITSSVSTSASTKRQDIQDNVNGLQEAKTIQSNLQTAASLFTTPHTQTIVYNSYRAGLPVSSARELFTNDTIAPVTLVDRESWENVVQSAPNMADRLNQPIPKNVLKRTLNLGRKKKEIHAISIEKARPRNITTKRSTRSTTQESFNIADMQEFARLAELQDDEMHGRISLRYIRQYAGPAIYNTCTDSLLTRQVYLINSSRILLTLNNFTLSRISVIMTSAMTLVSGESRCPLDHLECQVSGARVCVSSLAACDGVPNCGSFDIYDEDRLMCGAAKGLQHNVYLAAFTFLALLLTLFYGVHYWLKRCVPRVADAFFVYTDGVENILYLESIMRHPADSDNASKMFYNVNMFAGVKDELLRETQHSFCSNLINKCFGFCCSKKKEKEKIEETEIPERIGRKTYSFTQMELCNMFTKPNTAETSVQTGDSLEMSLIEHRSLEMKQHRRVKETGKAVENTKVSPIIIRDSVITLEEPLPEDELTLMKFFRDSRSNSSQSIIKETKLDLDTGAAPSAEKEISNVMYDDGLTVKTGSSGTKQKTKKHKVLNSKAHSRKRLRFDANTTTIPSIDDDDDDLISEAEQGVTAIRSKIWRNQNLGTIDEDEEQSSAGQPRHFWESNRKKTKKKSNVALR